MRNKSKKNAQPGCLFEITLVLTLKRDGKFHALGHAKMLRGVCFKISSFELKLYRKFLF